MPIAAGTDHRQHSESFDVVLVKKGVQAWEAKPDEFRRVSVTASEPSAARVDVEVTKAEGEGWTVHQVTGPGVQTHDELSAAARARVAPPPPKDLPEPTSALDRHGRRTSPLDVVMSKNGVSTLSAKPEDFRRITVSAADGADARSHDDVLKAEGEGWSVHKIVNPGVKTQDEHAAEQRVYAESMGPTDLRQR